MGSSSGGKVAGYRYKMGLHFGICQGPIDRLRCVIVGERTAWQGSKTANARFRIQAPQLFGGDEREGGIAGDAVALFGGTTQVVSGAVAAALPSPTPSFRGVFTLFYEGLISSNNPYIKPFAFKVQRTLAGWNGSAWLPEKCEIGELGPETFSLTMLQSRFIGGSAADESGFLHGSPTQSGGIVSSGGFRVDQDNAANPSTPSTLTYNWPGFGDAGPGPLTLEFFVSWEATPNIDYTPCVRLITDTTSVSTTTMDFGFTGSAGAMTFNDSGFGIEYTGTVAPPFPVHCAVVMDSGTKRVYIGGVRVYNATGATDPGTNPMRLILGDPAGYTSGLTRFSISGFRVRREALYTGATITPPTSIPDPDAAAAQTGNVAMNPAHIIYQCLTDPVWGMGYPTATIGPSFEDAANTLFDEEFGLCLLWNKQEELGAFIRVVLDHIGAVLYADPKTGLFELKLLRADYDPEDLPVFGPAEIVEVQSFQRVGYGDTINEVTVVFRDVETNRDTPVTVQNLANVQAQGAVVSTTRQYPGLPNASLALRVAQRDLIAASTPLAKARITLNREAWNLVPGAVFKMNFPKLGLSSVVMRVLDIDYGTLADGAISAEVAEDVFGLPASSYAAQEPIGWEEQDNEPAPIVHQEIIEAPYRGLVGAMTVAELAAVDEDSAYLCALAARPSSTATGFTIYSRVGAAEFLRRESGSFVPWGELDADIGHTDTALVLATGAIDLQAVVLGSLAIIGSGPAAEWVRVDAINVDTRTLTVSRGMLDTVPAAHDAGAPVWMGDGSLGAERVERLTAEDVDFRLLTRDGLGSLPLGAATTITLAGDQRQARPYPPGNLKINGVTYPASASDALTITWSHRDRLQQTADFIEQTAGSIGPEAGTTYSAELLNAADVVIASASGLTGTSWAPTITQGGTYNAKLRLWSVRGGLESWQRHAYTFSYTSAGVSIGATGKTGVVTASLVFPAAGASLALAYTQAPATASPGAAMVRFFTPALVLAEPVPAGQTFVINFGERANNAGPTYYLVQYQTTVPTTRETIVEDLKEQIDYLLANTTAPRLSDYIELVNVSDYLGTKWLHIIGKFGVEFMAQDTGVPDPPGVSRPTVTGQNTSMISWANGAAVVPADLPQIITATMSGTPNPGDLYTITLNGTAYTYTTQATDGAFEVIAGLAAAIDASPSFSATAAGATATISGVLPSNVFTYSSNASGARAFGTIAADPNWSSVTFLLNTNGADNSTTFTDASTGAHSITALANAKITSNRAVFDTISALRVPRNVAHHFGSGDFTVEARGDFTNQELTGDVAIAAVWKSGGLSWFFGIDNSRRLVFYYSTDGSSGTFSAFTSVTVPTFGTDFEVAASRISGVLRLFINGVKRYEGTHSAALHSPATTPLTIGGVDYSAPQLRGTIVHRRMRITKGVGRYSADYTPTSGPFGVG